MGEEWLTVIRRLWAVEKFDFDGDYFALKGVNGRPKPYGASQPVVMNAAQSPRGREFALRNCDFLFTTLFDLDEKTRAEIADFKRRANQLSRTVGVCVCAYVVCRPTLKEAEEYHRYYAHEHADWVAVDEIMKTMGTKVEPDRLDAFRSHLAGGAGLYPIIGDPDQVADHLASLHESGFDGAALGWVNYLDDLPFFRDEVLPRLEARGMRKQR
jgi:alkanesulfonate monooxygenase SsuD/methylene tetrahydromethanopterin reductase-like flavin-dependent oxidoreductase (luciferase family)